MGKTMGITIENEEIARRCYEDSYRIAKVFILAGQPSDAPSSDFKEYIEEVDFDELKGLFPTIPNAIIDHFRTDEFMDWLVDSEYRYGVIVVMETPIRRWSEDGRIASMSWGWYQAQAVYGDTIEEAVQNCFFKFEERIDARKKRDLRNMSEKD